MSKLKKIGILLPLVAISFSLASCNKTDSLNARTSHTSSKENSSVTINEEDLEKQVSSSILATAERYHLTELSTEAHKILGTQINGTTLTVYTLASIANFGFENENFTVLSGSGAIPTVIEYEINPTNNRYKEIKYLEPEDGQNYSKSIKKLFPNEYHEIVLNANSYYKELESAQINDAKDYLKSINRKAEIQTVQEKVYLELDETLLKVLNSKNMINYPNWEGSSEFLEKGSRYIYSSSHKIENGKSLYEFTKTNEDNEVIEHIIIDDSGNIIE